MTRHSTGQVSAAIAPKRWINGYQMVAMVGIDTRLSGSRIFISVSAPPREAPQLLGGRHEDERVLGFGAYSA
jgi:hypothetical protein